MTYTFFAYNYKTKRDTCAHVSWSALDESKTKRKKPKR